MLESIEKELKQEKDFLENEELATIYLGGGTPSLLKPKELYRLFNTVKGNYSVNPEAEITLEANPDDLSPEYLRSLKQIGINRLSIGIQSFFDEDLKLMNRRHSSSQSKTCLEHAYKAGFSNINLDLIYGLPGMSCEKWEKNLAIALDFKPAHVSAYHLGYEPGTVLEYRRRKGKILPVDEDMSLEHFKILAGCMEKRGYQHYEISNFALPGFISRHNAGYWKGVNYLGAGPSAHSYNGRIRRWNMPKNYSYIKGMEKGTGVYEEEILDRKTRFHDYLITSLRTMWGIDLDHVRKEWGNEYHEHVYRHSVPYINRGKIRDENGRLILTLEGMFIADHILQGIFL
jgi:oxygen-independent coproporphyrinogen-3 oxidase